MSAIIGENHIVRVSLFQTDGTTPLLLTDLVAKSVKIIQHNKTLATYVFGTDAEIRQGTTTSEIEIEIKKVVSEQFRRGKVFIELTLDRTDADFDVDLEHRDKQLIEILDVD